MTDTNRRWLLASRPVGAVKDSDFTLDSGPIPQPGEGEFLVRVTHLSFDPTQRGWLGGDTYLPAVKIGDPVRAGAFGQVIASHNPKFKVELTSCSAVPSARSPVINRKPLSSS